MWKGNTKKIESREFSEVEWVAAVGEVGGAQDTIDKIGKCILDMMS